MRWWNITTSLFSSFQASSIVITFYFDELSHLHLWNWKSERKSADRKIFRVEELGIIVEKIYKFKLTWRKLEFHKNLFRSGKFSTWIQQQEKKLSLNWKLLKRNSKWGNKYHFLFLKYAPSTLPTYLALSWLCMPQLLIACDYAERTVFNCCMLLIFISSSFTRWLSWKLPFFFTSLAFMRFLISLNYLLFSGFVLLLLIFHCISSTWYNIIIRLITSAAAKGWASNQLLTFIIKFLLISCMCY